eukprot:CAMPEP_0170082004 /NCGR_PEP_ID=MMETSP0019_2-20121128/17734_1 /TAXON_ID=98059 /ORGANISM="Dinobryon sp., Strain UTEXLB2267" /LENGTH=134 /DNA_ID=CAMNT_0010296725 /DNA_START=440 /DNA_END=841 /DNA_ORIENTATION=+
MGHASEDVMIAAVKSVWVNTGVSVSDIRRVYYREPCLVCILAKRNKDSKDRWSRRRYGRKARKAIIKVEPAIITHLVVSDEYNTDVVVSDEIAADKGMEEWDVGECISADNIGPINPTSIDGSTGLFMFRDTKS